MKERRFYIPQSFERKLTILEEILQREGTSLSAWFRKQAEEYVRLHELGNPQQRIDTVLKLGKSYRAIPLCSCGQRASRKVTTSKRDVIFCCTSHMPKDAISWKTLK